MKACALDEVRAKVLRALASVRTVDGKCTVNAARYLRYASRSAARAPAAK